MNVQKKLKTIGFKKSKIFLKGEHQYDRSYKSDGYYTMVPDMTERKYVDGKYREVDIIRSKFETFWEMKHGDFTLYIHLKKDTIYKVLKFDGKNVEEKTPCDKKEPIIINCKKDIIDLFPKAAKRRFTIESILKGK